MKSVLLCLKNFSQMKSKFGLSGGVEIASNAMVNPVQEPHK